MENNRTIGGVIYMIFAICTGVIGHQIHGSIGWAILDWIFAPLAWLKWLLCHEVNISIIKHAFDFFFK